MNDAELTARQVPEVKRRPRAGWAWRGPALVLAVLVGFGAWSAGWGREQSRATIEKVLRKHRPAGPGPVVAVNLEMAGLERFMPYSHRMPRKMMASAIRRLTALGAKVIAIEGTPSDRRSPEEDADLVDALKSSGNCVIAVAALYDAETQKMRLIPPAPPFAEAARGLGFLIGGLQVDLSRHLYDPLQQVGDGRWQPLPTVAANAFLDGKLSVQVHGPGSDELTGGAITSEANNPPIPMVPLVDVFDPERSGAMARTLAGKLVVLGKPMVTSSRREIARGDGALSAAARLAELGLQPGDEMRTAVLASNLIGGGLVRDAALAWGWVALPVLVALAALFTALAPRAGFAVLLALTALFGAAVLAAFRAGVHVNLFTGGAALWVAWALPALARVVQDARRTAALEAQLDRAVADLRAMPVTDAPARGPQSAMDRLAVVMAECLPERYAGAEFLGQGGMGVVYRARDARRGVEVAVKVLSPLVRENAAAVRRFTTEANTLKRLAHPGIVQVLDVELGVLPYFSMELLRGQPLDQLIAAGPMPVERAVALGYQLAEALAHVHAHSVVHRDLKPSNVMVLAGDRTKLLDFGLARDEDRTRQTKTGDVMGTLRYMPPEQFAGQVVGPAGDVYALALILCELITGTAPERGAVGHAVPRAQLSAAGAPDALVDLCARALATEPAGRPADGAALALELSKFVKP